MPFCNHAILDANMPSQLKTLYENINGSIGNQYETHIALLLLTT